MKTLLYFEDANGIKASGIGRARSHQMRALKSVGIDFTTNPKEKGYVLAHINTLWAKSHSVLRKCHKQGIPVIVHGHSTYEDFRNSFRCWKLIEPTFDRQIKYMYSHADYIITPTPYSKKLIESYGFNKKVVAISNGIDLNEYKEDKNAQKLFKEKFGLKEDEPFVMGIGFPFERKGLHDFIEVARSFPNIKFFWFGHLAHILTSTKMLKAMKNKPDNVILPGYVKGELIHGALQSATCLFFPSYEETEGIVVLEALASKCPLVLRNIGAYKPWLEDKKSAHFCNNNEEFRQEIENLLKNGEDPTILENGYHVAEERSLDKIGQQLKTAYEECISLYKKN